MDRLIERITARAEGYLWPRWLFLRALGAIFFSAFYSLAFQIHGLIGERGILPARQYLADVASVAGPRRFWYVPSVFWLGAGDRALTIVVALGLVASIAVVLNLWPRLAIATCTVLFLSCVTTLQDFSSYQSDGMLLEAGTISIFFAPGVSRGLRPGIAPEDPPTWISLFMLRWEWFRIYFESGLVKLMSGDPHWRNFTAMDDYYQNGPLPAWPGWYVQQLPHWYHAFTVCLTLAIELIVVWAVFLPRPFRIACALGTTLLQIGIISTANYAFLNYLVLVLGVLLIDDRAVEWVRGRVHVILSGAQRSEGPAVDEEQILQSLPLPQADKPAPPTSVILSEAQRSEGSAVWVVFQTAVLGWMLYATLWAFMAPGSRNPLALPEQALEPFRIANAYGLFATMTEARYEIEFQGSADGGRTWLAYPFRYKPQDVTERPGIYAPYQPRFDWNLWFASLEPWQASPWVVRVQARLIEGSRDVLDLFRRDPFGGKPPAEVRTVLWQYWFTDLATRRRTGAWWRRQQLGPFSGVLERDSTGHLTLHASP